MRVIFLDIDGVLTDLRSAGCGWTLRLPLLDRPDDAPVPPLAPACVERFNRLVETTGAQVVISSTWGRPFSTEDTRRYLERYGVRCDLLGRTPLQRQYRVRGDDIKQWLDDATVPVDAYCILDDHDDMGGLRDRLVRTDAATGLQDVHVDAAVALLT